MFLLLHENVSETSVYLTNIAFNSLVMEYANIAQPSLQGAEFPDCKRQLLQTGLCSKTHENNEHETKLKTNVTK